MSEDKNKIRLIALDIDGTLLNSRKELTDVTRRALISAQKRGIRLAIATGRPAVAVKKISAALSLDSFGGYIIAFNGAEIVAADNLNAPIREIHFPADCLSELCDMIRGRDVGISSYEGNTIIIGNCLTSYAVRNSEMLGLPYKYVGSLTSYVSFPVNKCLLTGKPDDIAAAEKEISVKFKDKLCAFRSDKFLLEVVSPQVNKGSALEFLAKTLDIAQSECMAFGDNYNDLSMIKYAGIGVAMGNAPDDVKSAADVIAPSNDCDGVAAVIKTEGI